MGIEPVHAVFHLDANIALIGVVRCAVQFQAAQAGFETETCAGIAAASEDVCREAASKLTDAGSGLDVSIDTFADRIDVSIMHRGQLEPPMDLQTLSPGNVPEEGSGGLNGLELLSRVDRVLYSTEGGKVRTTLVKYLKSKN